MDSLQRVPPGEDESQDRAFRVHRLAQLVRSGQYSVHSQRLAHALLEWDPRRAAPRQSGDGAEHRRAYMRDYMRRRRSVSLAGAALEDSHSPAPALA